MRQHKITQDKTRQNKINTRKYKTTQDKTIPHQLKMPAEVWNAKRKADPVASETKMAGQSLEKSQEQSQ
jgi:hypothetical protein